MERFIVAIDDSFVRGRVDVRRARGNFSLDLYRRRVLNWVCIHDHFATGSVLFFQESTSRDRRGWCLLVRGYSTDDPASLGGLGLAEMPKDGPLHVGVFQPVLSTYLDL